MHVLSHKQEKLLKYILEQERNSQNQISLGNQMPNYPKNINDKKIIQALDMFEKCNYIQIGWYGMERDNLDNAITIDILPDGENYFKNKRQRKADRRWDRVKWLIPLIISTISLLWNICNTLYSKYINDLTNSLLHYLQK